MAAKSTAPWPFEPDAALSTKPWPFEPGLAARRARRHREQHVVERRLVVGALLLQLDILGPEESQVGAELLRLARHDCDLFSGFCD